MSAKCTSYLEPCIMLYENAYFLYKFIKNIYMQFTTQIYWYIGSFSYMMSLFPSHIFLLNYDAAFRPPFYRCEIQQYLTMTTPPPPSDTHTYSPNPHVKYKYYLMSFHYILIYDFFHAAN
jgi:hypothetical protein